MATMKQALARLTREIEEQKRSESVQAAPVRTIQPRQSICRQCGGPVATGSGLCGEC
jgi:hypothetical protein